MPYPKSPFADNFPSKIVFEHGNDSSAGDHQEEFSNLTEWLCSTPKISSYRVNTLHCTLESVIDQIRDQLEKISTIRNCKTPRVYQHEVLKDVVIVDNYDLKDLELTGRTNEIIVDVHCGAAVLRGAHIFAPGIIGMTSGTKVDDEVSIYVDVDKVCKKGLKAFEGNKVYVGNGIARMDRHHLFGENLQPSGFAVEMLHSTSGCPPLGSLFLSADSALLQNIPSVVCIEALDPKPGDIILDMCASPGNKTTHIAAKINNSGTLIAIDKTPTKVLQLQKTCDKFNCKASIHKFDSTKIFDTKASGTENPPFGPETFDKILLDAPCSALGKRPQLANKDTETVIKSHIPLQRKLFQNAVKLLKTGGTMVYSTCTITLAENEAIVAWALKTFDCLQLVKAEPQLGGRGWKMNGLKDDQLELMQRFGPDDGVDSVGFFVAKFVKTKAAE
ncbi:PREDICTED: putative methyltransferase NSUN6 [Nicrophorus vespilloides]|uniref:Methyltransferase NSUN6 n=1 Tax=Nicrophorus vespilloides TaxID=110193 RepID=A0ABM1N1E2_NICVS|nr:PREDICTED: putative methyltransferase NSUN6 [Nicrophorus vespilloides]